MDDISSNLSKSSLSWNRAGVDSCLPFSSVFQEFIAVSQLLFCPVSTQFWSCNFLDCLPSIMTPEAHHSKLAIEVSPVMSPISALPVEFLWLSFSEFSIQFVGPHVPVTTPEGHHFSAQAIFSSGLRIFSAQSHFSVKSLKSPDLHFLQLFLHFFATFSAFFPPASEFF